jgi:integrase
MERMWEHLAGERAWDLLNPVINGDMAVGALYDEWVKAGHSLSRLRSASRDVDLADYLEPFLEWYRGSGVKEDTADHVEAHVRWLMKKARPRLASKFTLEMIATLLSTYPGTPSTRRKVHSSWSVWFDWLARNAIVGEVALSRMIRVPRPSPTTQPVRFYELVDVLRILEQVPSPEMKALWAFLYGTGAEISPALLLKGSDFDIERKEVRVIGTKTGSRDRICRVSIWAWEYVLAHWHVQSHGIPSERLWSFSRWHASKAHRIAVRAVKDPEIPHYPLYNARHHWAVRYAREGTPIQIIAAQLGHSDPALTLRVYGRFYPSSTDRDRWERVVAERDRPLAGNDGGSDRLLAGVRRPVAPPSNETPVPKP